MLLVQAYTVELEAELNHLKEENERLRAEEVLGTETFFFLEETEPKHLFIISFSYLVLCIDLIRDNVSVPFCFAEDDSAIEEKDGNFPLNRAILLRSVDHLRCQCNNRHALSRQCPEGNLPWLLCLFQLVEKMMEQARENVSAKKGGRGLRRWGSAMW